MTLGKLSMGVFYPHYDSEYEICMMLMLPIAFDKDYT